MSVEMDFIKAKGLTEEFNTFKKEWQKKEDALKVDYKYNISYMLGDGDGDIEDEFSLTAKEREELIKYFEALPPDIQIAEVEDEWRPGSTFYSSQILKMLKGEEICCPDDSCRSCSTITSKMRKVKAFEPMDEIPQDEYEELVAEDFENVSDNIDDFSDMIFYIYNIHVRNWIKIGAKKEDAVFNLNIRFYT